MVKEKIVALKAALREIIDSNLNATVINAQIRYS